MRHSTIKQMVVMAIATVVLAAPVNQAAAFSMDDMVNDYTSSTVDPNAQMTLDGRRGFVSGGSLRVRFDNKPNPDLYKITLPSVKADCNGIDMHLGSLSWISADEFMDAARRMASPQVLIYALGLALNQMCGPCAQKMAELQDELNKYAGLLKKSCEELGTALYEKSGMKEKAEEKSAEWWGESQDETGDDAAETEDNSLQAMLDANRHDEISENLVWDHMNGITVGGWLSDVAGENLAKEMIMTISGTHVTDATGADYDYEITYDPKGAVPISLKKMVTGGSIQGLICNDNYADCLDVREDELFVQDDMATKFFKMLDPSRDDSIPTKFLKHEDGIKLEAPQLAFMTAAQRHFDIQFYMYSLAMAGQTITERDAQTVSEMMAIEITLAFMLDYVETASIVLSNIDNTDDIKEVNPFELKAGFRKEAEQLREELAQKLQSTADLSTILVNTLNR